jgi:hypothetical protein
MSEEFAWRIQCKPHLKELVKRPGVAVSCETGDPEDNYARSNLGGARGARMTLGDAAVDVRTGGAWYHAESDTKDGCRTTVSAGCVKDFEAEDLSPPDSPMLRLLLGDSSISARIARMSSVAEITGKSTTSRQPSAKKVW